MKNFHSTSGSAILHSAMNEFCFRGDLMNEENCVFAAAVWRCEKNIKVWLLFEINFFLCFLFQKFYNEKFLF